MKFLISALRITAVVLALTLTMTLAWIYLQELALCTVIGLTTLLFCAWWLGFPNRNWLRADHAERVKAALKDRVYDGAAYKNLTRPPVTVGELYERLPLVPKYTVAVVRLKDTDEFVDECAEGITKGLIFYAFVSIASVMGYFQSQQAISEEAAKAAAAVKLYAPFVYLGLTLAYLCWLVSPVMLHRKRNHAVEE